MAYALSAFSASNTRLNVTRKALIPSSEGLRRFTIRTEGSTSEDAEESDKSSTATIAAVVALGALGLYFMQRR